MGYSFIRSASILCLCVVAQSVRISPKLDFGTDNNAPEQAGIKSTFQTGSNNHGNRERVNKIAGVDISCVSGNCNVTGKENGVSTDVLVHIKTNVDVSGKTNSTEAVPDVPVIAGTKTISFPTYAMPNLYNELPPLPISSLVYNRAEQAGTQLNSSPDFRNYPSGYQDNTNVADFYHLYKEPNSDRGNLPLPQFTWNNPKPVDGVSNYNPLEFKKHHGNSWPDLSNKWTDGGVSNSGNYNFPNQRRCICPNPEIPYYQPTPERY